MRGNASEVPLGPDDGHVQTVARGRLGALLTILPTQRIAEIREALLFALDM